jgi:hypothetical protein
MYTEPTSFLTTTIVDDDGGGEVEKNCTHMMVFCIVIGVGKAFDKTYIKRR